MPSRRSPPPPPPPPLPAHLRGEVNRLGKLAKTAKPATKKGAK